DGNYAEYGEHDPFDQKEYPMPADRAHYSLARLLHFAFDRGHGGISRDCVTQECLKLGNCSIAQSTARAMPDSVSGAGARMPGPRWFWHQAQPQARDPS